MNRDLLDWAETLLCNAQPMGHCSQEEWNRLVAAWRDEKHQAVPDAPATLRRSPSG